jgi:hypothetical protein
VFKKRKQKIAALSFMFFLQRKQIFRLRFVAWRTLDTGGQEAAEQKGLIVGHSDVLLLLLSLTMDAHQLQIRQRTFEIFQYLALDHWMP